MRASTIPAIGTAALLAAGAAHAQDGGLTRSEARSFLGAVTTEAEESISRDDWRGVREWAQRNLGRHANFAIKGTVVSARGPVMTYSATLDADTLRRFGNATMMSPHDVMGDTIEDYAHQGNVEHLTMLPNGEASALLALFETATIAFPAAKGEARAGGDSESGTVSFQSNGMCDLRLARADGNIVIRAASCTMSTTM